MRNIWTIARREYKNFFATPAAYGIAFMILIILGVIFYANMLAATYQQYAPNVQFIISPLVTLLLFSTPAITMRTLSDEQRLGTMELLMTYPVRDWELIIGKWLGASLFQLSLIAVTLVYPLILNQFVDPGIDQGILVTGYIGLALLAVSFISIGIAVSSFFSNQIAVFFTTLGVLLLLWMIGFPSQAMGGSGSQVLQYLDMSGHFYNTFYKGILDLKDLIYFASLTTASLLIGFVSVEARRWR